MRRGLQSDRDNHDVYDYRNDHSEPASSALVWRVSRDVIYGNHEYSSYDILLLSSHPVSDLLKDSGVHQRSVVY